MSCLFQSLQVFLHIEHNQIRQNICDYLEQNKPIIDGMSTDDLLAIQDNQNPNQNNNNYVANMRLLSTMGGAIEILAACNIWNLKIIVINIRDKNSRNIEFLPIHNNIQQQICLTWNGGHYEPHKQSII